MIKKLLLWIMTCLSVLWWSFAQVSLNPVYSSERFQPSDKFHAGCENQMDVVFHLDNSKINGVNAILYYEWSKIEILRIAANKERENNLTYTVENNKIIFSKLKTAWDGLDDVAFSVFFKVKNNVESTKFSLEKWSYVVDSKWSMIELEWDYDFQFIEVPECDPDIVAPVVELVFPSDKTGDFVALDTYFQFEIYDAGKWVNEDSIKIMVDKSFYTLSNVEHTRNDKILTVYPDTWMPFNTGFEVQISVSDRQAYWKPNTTVKFYKFQTSGELNFLNTIDPVEFRKIVNMDKYLRWTEEECSYLSYIYSRFHGENWDVFDSINTKLWCEELFFQKDLEDIDTIVKDNIALSFSVFSILGWMLFGTLLISVIFGWLWKK